MAVTSDDVVALLGRDLSTGEAARVDRLIEFAAAAVEDELPGFSFATVDDQTDAIVWHNPDVVWTPRYPVREISSISVGGIVVDQTFYRFAADAQTSPGTKGKIELFDAGSLWVVNSPALIGWPLIDVTYSFGLADTPLGLVNLVAGMVATTLDRQTSNPEGVQSEAMMSYSVTYFAQLLTMAVGAEPAIEASMKRWRREPGSVILTRSR